MSDYRRSYIPGGCYFFTVVCWQRRPVFDRPERFDLLREAFRVVKKTRPFSMDTIVVLPNHLHCIWQLPKDDSDYSSRWREIKKYVTRRITPAPTTTAAQLWQPRFWEHCIRDAEDWRRHVDYIHYNPVKHGLSSTAREWKYSSFLSAVRRGWYQLDWGRACPENLKEMNRE